MMNLCAMKQPFKHWTIIFLKHLKSLEILFFKIFIVIQLQLYAFSPHGNTLKNTQQIKKNLSKNIY